MTDGLAHFTSLVREDPLFASEGMDLENGRHALDVLESRIAPLERAYANGSLMKRLFFVRYPLARYVYPLRFLRSFLESERLRRAFIETPTPECAAALAKSWGQSARAYREDLKRYRAFHEILRKLEPDGNAFVMEDFFGNRTSYRYALSLIDALLKNADELAHEADARRKMLAGDADVSARPHTSAPRTVERIEADELGARIHRAEIAGGISPYRYADILESHGPLSFSLSQYDGEVRSHTFMWYLMRDRENGLRSMWLSVLSRHSFAKIWEKRTPTDTIARGVFASAVGISPEEMPYWYEPIGHFYNVRDQSYWIDIATSLDLARRSGIDRDLVRCERSSSFDLMLAEGARDLVLMRAHQIRRNRTGTAQRFSYLYELLARSYPYLYYLVFNGSVQRVPAPAFVGERFQPSDRGRLARNEIELLSDDELMATLSAARLREERGVAAGWL